MLGELAQDFYEDSWTTYPAGFIKYVKIDEQETEEINRILEEMTGLTESREVWQLSHFMKRKLTKLYVFYLQASCKRGYFL